MRKASSRASRSEACPCRCSPSCVTALTTADLPMETEWPSTQCCARSSRVAMSRSARGQLQRPARSHWSTASSANPLPRNQPHTSGLRPVSDLTDATLLADLFRMGRRLPGGVGVATAVRFGPVVQA